MTMRTQQAFEAGVRFLSAGPSPVDLEGLLGTHDGRDARPAMVLCHPGGQGQTGLEYPVIAACTAALHQAGLVTLRFNFRGVQGSTGSRTGGLCEADDVRGAVRFLRRRADIDSASIYLLGNSFGAQMVLDVAREDEQVAGMACIVLPFDHLPSAPDYLCCDCRPKLFIAAEHDQFCNLGALAEAYQQWAEYKELIVLKGSDHFLGIGPATVDPVNRSAQIAEAVTAWLGHITAQHTKHPGHR